MKKYWLLMGIGILTGCGSSSSVAGNNSNSSPAIIVEAAANIPVLDGNSTQTGIYVRNTSNKTISGISYELAKNGSKTSLTLNTAVCHTIEAHSSCLLPITTPALTTPGDRGASVIVAKYDNTQSKQLVNYSYVSAKDCSGVSFSDTSEKLFGSDNYATIYVFAGNHQTIDNVGFTTSSNSVQISNGLTNGHLNLAANTVNALEIHSSANVTERLATVTASQFSSHSSGSSRLHTIATADSSTQSNTLTVTITATQQANLLMSNIPILTNDAPSATVTLANNGNRDAILTGILTPTPNIDSVSVAPAVENPCVSDMSLASGATCSYVVSKVNTTKNGNATLNQNYNNSISATSVYQTVYYHNDTTFPAVAAVPTATQLSVPINTTSGNIIYNVTNYGSGALKTMGIIPKTTLQNTTASIEANSCGSNIEAGARCMVVVKITATGLIDSGVVYLDVGGSFTDGQGVNHSLNFASEATEVTVIDSSLPTVTSTTPQDAQTKVSISTGVVVNFSEPMMATTLTTSNIQLQKVSNSGYVSLTSQGVTNNNHTVTFSLSSGHLEINTQYRIIINPSQIQDINGNAMSAVTSETIAKFITSGDDTVPTISSFTPADGATNQSRTPAITLTFSEAMDQATLTPSNIILQTQGGTTVTGTSISYDNVNYIAIVNLNSTQLTSQTTYQLIVNQNNIKDIAGRALGTNAGYQVSQFTVWDFTAPELSTTVPLNGASNIIATSAISLTFSGTMNTGTLTASNIKLQKVSDSSVVTLGTPAYSNNNQTVTFQPTAALTAGDRYSIVINPSAIKDTAGNAMGSATSQTVSSFTVAEKVVGIALPQTGQLYCVPGIIFTTTCSADHYASVPGTDGYGLYGTFTPYGVTWAFNGMGALNPTQRFTTGTKADNTACPSDQVVRNDNLTGLMWVQNLDTINSGHAASDWQNALDVVAAMNSTGGYCGYTDWRLPNVNELASMVNLGADNSAWWLAVDGDFNGVRPSFYWSSTPFTRITTDAFAVDMNAGSLYYMPMSTNNYRVWPVRGTTALPAPALIPQTGQTATVPLNPAPAGSDGALQMGTVGTTSAGRFVTGVGTNANCITDSQTGLMWPKNGVIGFTSDSGSAAIPLAQPDYNNTDYNLNYTSWAKALTAVANMNSANTKLCGHSDWRLPNRNELHSLVNYGVRVPGGWLDNQGFTNMENPPLSPAYNRYWSSTTNAAYHAAAAWVVDMTTGEFLDLLKSEPTAAQILPVRGGQ